MPIPTFRLKIEDSILQTSSTGNLRKWTQIYNNRIIFIKTSSYNEYNNTWAYEAYAEIIASKLAIELGIKNVVKYYPCKIVINDASVINGCYCYNFLETDEKYVSLAKFNKISVLKNYTGMRELGYRHLLSDIEGVFGIKYRTWLDTILIFDALIMNADRHMGNLGLIVCNDGKIKKAPIFDNGASFLSHKDVSQVDYGRDLEKYIIARPFAMRFSEQLSYADRTIMKTWRKNTPNTLRYIMSLKNQGIDEHRLEFMCELIKDRLNMINSI